MGFLDRLLGREEPRRDTPQSADGWNADSQSAHGSNAYARNASQPPARSDDEIAVERYRYLLRTAPPETIEQVHEEAFARLTADQRRLLFQQLSEGAPAGERPRGDDPRSLAQAATRSELRQPGTLERSLAGPGSGAAGGMGFGGMLATSLLGSVAGYVIGSALVSAFLPTPGADQAADGTAGDGSGGDGTAADTGSGDAGSGSGDAGSGSGDAGVETASADAGWGGDSGGWGGGDAFGGGWDGGGFGGGDFGGDFL